MKYFRKNIIISIRRKYSLKSTHGQFRLNFTLSNKLYFSISRKRTNGKWLNYRWREILKLSLFRWGENEKQTFSKFWENSFLLNEKMISFSSSKYSPMQKVYFESFFLCETSNWIVPKGSFSSLNTVSSLNINYICNILNCTFSYYILIYYIFNINNVLI